MRLRASALGLALALTAFVRPAEAQQFTTNDPVLQRIWTLGMDSSRAEEYMQVLLDSVGPRLTGSPGHRSGNEWLVRTYGALGIEARNEQYGTWKGWRRGVSHIDLMAPRVRSLEGQMLAWSPGTGGRAVEAPAIILPDVADSAAFARWLPQAKGKHVLISFPQPTCRPDTSWKAWATPESFAKMDTARTLARDAFNQRLERTGYTARTLPVALEQAGARGIVTSLWSNGWGVNKIFQARTERIPTVDLSCEDYGLVWRLAENEQAPRLRITADAEFMGEVPVFNTIATIPGTEKPDEYVVLSAHFDSWDGSSGATDNGTGTITMLEAMRILKAVYPQPKRTIIVGHWGGEEQGLNGSRAFAADHQEIVQGLQVLLNQDNGTGRVSNISLQGFTGAGADFARWLSQVPSDITQHIDLQLPGFPGGGGSDYAAFVCYGAPSFSLSSNSWEYGTYTWHTNRDTYDKVSFDEVRNNATLTAMLAYLAANQDERVAREQRSVLGSNPRTGEARSWPECQTPARTSGESTR
ncbi:MAG: M20/M25/M40 family metallo-hydrolase [Actinomycetota bacterium]|nr:M20/M25/M40 family metallo-hydrolase [Actinomycetota bacterium]